jgi:hypothetical protein
VILVASFLAAPAAAYVPSAVDQYTEQPPTGPGGPGTLGRGDGLSPGGGSGSGDGSDPAGGGPSFGGGSSGDSGGGAGESGAGGGSSSGGGAIGGGSGGAGGDGMGNADSRAGGATGDGRATAENVSDAQTLPVGGYPTNTLLWIALAAVVAAAAIRVGVSLRNRLPGSAAH